VGRRIFTGSVALRAPRSVHESFRRGGCALSGNDLTSAENQLLILETAMSRLVRLSPQPSSIDPATGGLREEAESGLAPLPATPPDNYLERIAKYVPVEVLAFSVFINAILDQAMRSGGSTPVMVGVPVITIAIVALIAGMAAAPFFVWYIHNEGDAWVTNAVVCFFAFPFWSYAMGAVAFAGYRDGNLAVILLATFTVVSGTIKPSMPKPRQVAEAREAGRKEGPRLVDLNSPMNVPGNGWSA
jgi:hypothetical protein